MKIETMREQVRAVAQRWRNQYGNDPKWSDRQQIQKKLDALNVEKATRKDVEKIIGNGAWVCPPTCDECGKSTWKAVEVGAEPDYDSRTATICIHCLRKAVALVESYK